MFEKIFEKEQLIIINGAEILTYATDYWFLGIFIGICIIGILIYFLPSFIAIFRHHRDKFFIFIINVFFGWSVFGWLVVLIWSLMRR